MQSHKILADILKIQSDFSIARYKLLMVRGLKNRQKIVDEQMDEPLTGTERVCSHSHSGL